MSPYFIGVFMAVWVYKENESELIDALHLENALKAGWSVTKGEQNGVRKEEKTSDGSEEETDSEIEVLKQQAKEVGIKGWQRMSEQTLRDRLDG